MLKLFALIYIACGFAAPAAAMSRHGFDDVQTRIIVFGGALLLGALFVGALIQTTVNRRFLTLNRQEWLAMIPAFAFGLIAGCFI